MAVVDQRRLHPQLTATDLARTAPFVPELTPVVDARGNDLMTRPWLDWARRLTLVVQSLATGGGGGGGGGTPDPHAPTHEPGGSDPMTVDAAPATGSLRTLGSGPNQAAPGNDVRFTVPANHAPRHSAGGADPVTVTNLAGYPGGTTTFLRADHTFAVPPGGAGGGMNLDYLGNYTSGPIYNDGDIVIGSDGVAYMCVVDGTLTPPEPWPGAGIAVNVSLDATYWVVSPHSQLTNERAMNALGTGYVRSTVGEPSVVPTIPLTDTTGILPDNRLTSNVALKNQVNQFTQNQRISNAGGDLPRLTLTDLTQPFDTKTWQILTISQNLNFWALSDSEGSVLGSVVFGRTGLVSATGFSGGGAGLTNLNASNLATGLAAPLRLGNGTPDATTFLRGDSTWAAIPSTIPSGMIVLSDTACPPGWTRVTAWDGRYIRSGVGGVGGNASHAHAVGSYSIPAHDHGTPTTSPVGDHAHNFGIHAYFDSGNDSAGLLNVDGGSSGNMSRGPHTHRTQIDFDGGTSNSGNHSHTVGIPSVGPIALQGGSEYAATDPLFVDLFLCRKN